MIFRLFVEVERRDAQFNFSFLLQDFPPIVFLIVFFLFFPYVPIFLRQLPTTKKHLGVQNGGGGGDMSSEGAEEQRREVFTAPRSSNFGRAFMHALFYDAPSVGQVAYGAHLRCKAPNPNHTKPRDRQSNKFTDIHSHPLILWLILSQAVLCWLCLTSFWQRLGKYTKAWQGVPQHSRRNSNLNGGSLSSSMYIRSKVKALYKGYTLYPLPNLRFVLGRVRGPGHLLNFGTCSPIASTFTKVSYSILCGQSIPTKVVSFSKVSNSKNRKMAAVTNVCCTQLR